MSSISLFVRKITTIAAAAALAIAATSCAGRVETTLRQDGSASLVLKSEIPYLLALRIRDFGRIPASTPLFDVPTAKTSLEARTGVTVTSIDAPGLESINASISIADIKALLADKDIAEARMASFTQGKGWSELRISLSRSNARSVYRLVPGIDKRLVEALSPPALEEDPVTPAEYRMNLETAVIGKKNMPAFDSAAIDITIKAPAAIIASGGGKVTGKNLTLKLPLFDLLTLEKPVEFWLRWSN